MSLVFQPTKLISWSRSYGHHLHSLRCKPLEYVRSYGQIEARPDQRLTFSDGFDFIFILIYLAYLVFRMYGLHRGNTWARETGTDILAIGECAGKASTTR